MTVGPPAGPHSPDSSTGRTVLVIGSYPPVPTAGAVVTVETVRRLWAEGAQPSVASPRDGAAELTVAVTGVFAGRRLENLRTLTGAGDIVICAERDLPIPTTGRPRLLLPLVQRLTADGIVRALARFDHVTLVACGDTAVPAAVWARLVFAADTVVDRSEVRGTPGVTTLGPSANTPAGLARSAWRRAAPLLLGGRAPAAQRLLSRFSRTAQSLVRGRSTAS